MRLFKRAPSRSDFEREAMPHLPALYGVALRLTRHEGDADDLVQETMLRAYRFFDSFEAGTNCKAWLFRILHNTFCNRYREREREQEILDQAESSDANIGQFVSANPHDTESSLLGRMVSADVEKALAEVPSEFRMAVILADLEDFSYKEIAEIMECPAGTVMSRLYRGRRILQKLLYDYAIEQGIVKGPVNVNGEDDADAPIDLATYRKAMSKKASGEGGVS